MRELDLLTKCKSVGRSSCIMLSLYSLVNMCSIEHATNKNEPKLWRVRKLSGIVIPRIQNDLNARVRMPEYLRLFYAVGGPELEAPATNGANPVSRADNWKHSQ